MNKSFEKFESEAYGGDQIRRNGEGYRAKSE